ncbi:unnamed protein product [Didymodactylos carnosus]|uniref:Kinesin motor domain-containing protein n=1 Tax=Didymodactylos carnosus TaxID=1234261 RepID=A0A8S2CXF2_9BILA|nr:unnamed protein product [Didymodactylos carnosus]CAF3528090.1 unnamed protein product [Didymodactylos carnosus]
MHKLTSSSPSIQYQVRVSYLEVYNGRRLNLIDLAGSEVISRSKAEGDRFREAVNINTELLQLRRVLDALSASSSYIPYRDSTLTRLLQSSLSTTQSITILISHISDIMFGNYNDIVQCFYRRTVYIHTPSYGKIFARLPGHSTRIQQQDEITNILYYQQYLFIREYIDRPPSFS